MNINYSSNLYSSSLSFYLPTFGLRSVFPRIARLRLSFGAWIRLTADEVSGRSSNLDPHSGRNRIYETLSGHQFRLLTIYPGQSHEPLRGELSTSRVRQGFQAYAAISYCWGSIDCMQTIWIHGIEMPILHNLAQCLRHLRDEHRPVVLWTDSLCINQMDVEDMNTQVNMMDSIYESSQEVKIWLGAEEGHSGIGMQVLEYFATNVRPDPEAPAPWQRLPPNLVALGLSEVMNRPWFKRMWVVQEAALPRRVQMVCGDHSFAWTTDYTRVRQFMRMVKYAAIQPEWRESDLARIDMEPLLELLDLQMGKDVDKCWGGSHRHAPDILDMAYALRHRKSADPRDMIFALHGLVKYNCSGERLQPDYRLTVNETYEHLATVIDF